MQSETVTIEDTLDLIDVRGRDFDTLVLSRGKPLAINWHDCAGSVAQYLVRAGVSDYEPDLVALRHILNGNVAQNVPLSSQFHVFLQLLAAGTYNVSIDTYNAGDIIESQAEWVPERDYDNFYPIDTTLVLTQPTSALSRSTINDYASAIRSGQRPILLAVTAEDAWCTYVIDGHHKAIAYRQMKTKPTVLLACRLSPPTLPSDTFHELFTPTHPLAAHYRKQKLDA